MVYYFILLWFTLLSSPFRYSTLIYFILILIYFTVLDSMLYYFNFLLYFTLYHFALRYYITLYYITVFNLILF